MRFSQCCRATDDVLELRFLLQEALFLQCLGDLWISAPEATEIGKCANTHTGEMRTPRCRGVNGMTHAAPRKKSCACGTSVDDALGAAELLDT